jgi:hypothetical protein
VVLWLPLVNEIFCYLAAVSWTDLDFPAAEFFDFAADSACFAGDNEFAVFDFAFNA